MKKLYYVCFFLLSLSCIEDDGGGPGGCVTASDFSADLNAAKSSQTGNEDLVLEYLDTNGKNLIENNTYNPVDISIRYGNNTLTEVVDLQNKDTKYLVYVYGFSKGKNSFSVTLSPSETDTMLVFASEVGFSPCTGPEFAIDSVYYNDEKQAMTNVTDWIKKVSIVK